MRRRTPTTFHTRHPIKDGTLVIDLRGVKRVLSSAPCGGGQRTARFILNHQVKGDPISSPSRAVAEANGSIVYGDPSATLRLVASKCGLRGPVVGLMTAVPMKRMVRSRTESNGFWVECFATVGVTNAVRAGEPFGGPPSASCGAGQVGTINLIVVTNAALASSAMVGAIQVVTESKTGVLRDQAVPCWTGNPGATGTGTDAVVIACARRGAGIWQPYSGTHTMIGAMIGQVVADCMRQGLALAERWAAKAGDRS